MSFSLLNGLKMTWAHLHDEQMVIGWIFFIPLISGACFIYRSWVVALIWFVVSNIIYILIRCWDNPVKLGWCDK